MLDRIFRIFINILWHNYSGHFVRIWALLQDHAVLQNLRNTLRPFQQNLIFLICDCSRYQSSTSKKQRVRSNSIQFSTQTSLLENSESVRPSKLFKLHLFFLPRALLLYKTYIGGIKNETFIFYNCSFLGILFQWYFPCVFINSFALKRINKTYPRMITMTGDRWAQWPFAWSYLNIN